MLRRKWKRKLFKRKQIIDNKKLTIDYNIPNPVKEMNKQIDEEIEMKIKGEKAIKLDDGKYTGEVMGIEYRDKPFNYTDILIKEKKSELTLKCGVPTKITEDTMLGMLIINFGVKEIEEGKEYDIEEIVKGKVEFMVVNKKTDKGSFCNILPASVKPIK